MLDPKQCVLFSGGAAGAEQFFGAQAEAWGIEEVNYSFEGHQIERARGVRVLTQDSDCMIQRSYQEADLQHAPFVSFSYFCI